MRMFRWKSLPGWFVFILGGCWKLLEALSTSEFAFKILWLEKPMMPFLAAIILSPWFPFVLMIVGAMWIWWFSRPAVKLDVQPQLDLSQNDDLMSLKEACERLYQEKEIIIGYSTGSLQIESTRPDEHFNNLSRLFVEKDDIYGKSPSSHFKEWRIISKDKFILGKIKLEEGELVLYGPGNYVGKTPEYVSLAIKRSNLTKDIKIIIDSIFMPLSKAIQYLYNECVKIPLFNKYIEKRLGSKHVSRNMIWNDLAETFVEYTSIAFYGKDEYSTELREIDIRSHLGNLEFYHEASTLSLYDVNKQYNNISIKESDVWQAIEAIKEELIKIIGKV